MEKKKILTLRSGEHEITFELNDWAARASTAVVVRAGGTVILTTVVKGKPREGADFTPLTVDYEEKYYAAGKILGSRFIRREGRPTDHAILTGRAIDRTIRPALAGFTNELQIINTVFSYDEEYDPGLLALLGSSLALDLLGLDWAGPIGAVRIGRRANGEFVINPKRHSATDEEAPSAGVTDFNFLVAGTGQRINMIEFEGTEVSEADLGVAAEQAQAAITEITAAIRDFSNQFVTERTPATKPGNELLAIGKAFIEEHDFKLDAVFEGKNEGDAAISPIFDKLEALKDELGQRYGDILQGILQTLKEKFKKTIIETERRPDGRALTEIRPLRGAVDILPRPHGSAIFQRGLTHIIGTVTLAGPGEDLIVQGMEFDGPKRIMHHYNFPPYSTGEIKRLGGTGRREIGHGALVEKAIRRVIPAEADFPYAIRIVSDAVCSNGSTSMASICASTLALMDAGVPIRKPVAGISVGIVYAADDRYRLLTDIQGPEDHYGGMDFKVIATDAGVLAIQMDVKFEGLTTDMFRAALAQAHTANEEILVFLKNIIPTPRAALKPGAPQVSVIKIDSSRIGLVIGGGGKTIQEITATTNTKIDIRDDGTVYIAGPDAASAEEAKQWILGIAKEVKIGDLVQGEVVKILPMGAIVEFGRGQSGLLHISEISDRRVERVEDELELGQDLTVRIKQVRPDGKISLSLKDARGPAAPTD